MRSIEIVLVLCGVLQLLTLMFRTRKASRAAGLIGAAGAGALAAHLIFEGYRWQMAIPYALTLTGILIVILGRSQGENGRKVWKALRFLGYGTGCLLLVGSALLASAMPVLRMPEPEGAYAVGTETFHLVDGEREETFTEEPDDKRELMVQIWYPAQLAHPEGNRVSLFPEDRQLFKAYAKAYAAEMNLPAFLLDYWKYFQTNSYSRTPIDSSGKPFPLVLISHGEGTGRLLHVSQAENLASHGYIVVAVDHTYSTLATAFPDGRVSGYTVRNGGTVEDVFDRAERVGAVWTQDIAYVIRSLEKMDDGDFGGGFQGRIDMERIGMLGHSFGGATAFRAVNDIPNIRAGINMDGTLYGIQDRDGMNKPFLFLESEDFLTWKTKLEQGEVTDPAILKRLSAELATIDRAVNHGGTMIAVEGASHYNFTDLQLFTEMLDLTGMTGPIKGNRGARLVNDYVLDFFDKHLKGTGNGELLKGPSPQYPEAKFP
ncbi:alpha/beta hydrolase family protein [Paenibacillus harenae]|uniref:alpha/beta hydrolase family protein n=1 Tax=Paenibacillus harenae TaxID=306543 RepID=UPI00278F2457|nr:hypothetical protein [Paenibacillus harenae]MDQ0060488.1 putative dienelactone hydrolase [Paenibacillus harenae]